MYSNAKEVILVTFNTFLEYIIENMRGAVKVGPVIALTWPSN